MELPHFFDLAQLTEADLDRVDVAHVNLACAVGLPGAEHMDPSLCERAIVVLTEFTRAETERVMPAFERNPSRYRNSEAYFRVLVMITALQRDCGVRYDPGQIPEGSPFQAENAFVFGIFQGNGGTCATLPVLYASVGRRLGYPIVLIDTFGHLFARWDDGRGESFNIEATGKGLSTHDDEYYRQGQYARGVAFEDHAGYLRPLTARRTLAGFLANRAVILWNAGYCRDAAESLAWAAELDGYPSSGALLRRCLEDWETRLKRLGPTRMPGIEFHAPARRFRLLPQRDEDRLILLSAFEDLLADADLEREWWAPMRKDPTYLPPSFQPTVSVRYTSVPKFANGRQRQTSYPHV